MRRPILIASATLVATTGLAGPAAAQDPPPWEPGPVLNRDLDGDGVRDEVVVLTRTDRDNDEQRPDRRLIVSRGEADGSGFERIEQGRRALICTTCGGAFHGEYAPVHVRIRGGVIVVKQSFGSRVVTRQTLRFRVEGDGVRLIGYDRRERDRATGRRVSVSTDLLTGERIRVRRSAGGDVRRTRRASTCPSASSRARTGATPCPR